jgi:DNA-binding SARP family transcriptional activator
MREAASVGGEQPEDAPGAVGHPNALGDESRPGALAGRDNGRALYRPLTDAIAEYVAPALGPERDERPVVYELTRHELALASDTGVRLGPPLGDGTVRPTWTLAYEEHSGGPPTGGVTEAADLCLATVPNEGGPAYLVDLIAAECTSVVGPAGDVDRVIDAVIRSALTSRIRRARILVVGELGPPRAARVPAVAEIFATLAESTEPVAVFVGTPCADDELERLVAAVHRHPASGIVVPAAHTAARAILVAGRRDRCAVYLRAPGPPKATAPAVAADRADALPGIASGSGPIEVAILGPVEIRGSAFPLAGHPRLTELVVYLAMHPEGATTPAWETALWPERRMPPQTIANRLSEARRALGFTPDGRSRLRKSGERHRIADVTTDWERFKSLAARENDPEAWHDALGLVRGRPFLDLHQGQWTALEGYAVEIEHAIVGCALRLGRFALGAGRPDDAIWAAQRALRATPWDERLHRLLMEAADAAGDRAGVEVPPRSGCQRHLIGRAKRLSRCPRFAAAERASWRGRWSTAGRP